MFFFCFFSAIFLLRRRSDYFELDFRWILRSFFVHSSFILRSVFYVYDVSRSREILQVFLPLLDVSEFYRRKNSLRHEKSKRLSKVWKNWHKKTGIVNDVYFMISLYILQYFACTFFTYTLVQAFTFDCRFVEALKFAETLKKVYFCIFFFY
jgi:hypothetical protein